MPERFLRRGDDRLVEALAYTGGNAAEIRAWLIGYRVAEDGWPLVVTGRAGETLEAWAGDWLVRDDDGVRVVRAYAFYSRYQAQPVE